MCCNRHLRHPWNSTDEYNWKKGYVICPLQDGREVLSDDFYYRGTVAVNPLSHCPYALEHIVVSQSDAK